MNDTKFSVNNYNGCTVTCSNEHWNSHVAGPHHAIMENNVRAVKDTIKDPDSVYESSQSPKREVYFKSSEHSTYKGLLTKVIVEYSPGINNPNNIVGHVVTAFPHKNEEGGIGNVVYRKNQN